MLHIICSIFQCKTPNQVSYISLNYVYFDYIPIVKKWIRENKAKYNIRDLEPKDKIMISPITTILDNHAEHLYEVGFKTMNFKVLQKYLNRTWLWTFEKHPFVKKYCAIKMRTDFIRCAIVLNVIVYFMFALCLNVFAFELQPAWQVLSAQNSGENNTISAFCETDVCRNSKLASYVLISFRVFITFIQLIHSR